MGLQSKSDRGENDPISFKFDDMDFNISFDFLNDDIKLDEKSLVLLEEAILADKKLRKDKKTIVAGNYEVKLNSSLEVNLLWEEAFDKLIQKKFIIKNGKSYIVTDKALKYYENI